MKLRFTNEQIILIIKEQESDEKTADVCRPHTLSGRALKSKVPRVGAFGRWEMKAANKDGEIKNLHAKISQLAVENAFCHKG